MNLHIILQTPKIHFVHLTTTYPFITYQPTCLHPIDNVTNNVTSIVLENKPTPTNTPFTKCPLSLNGE